VLTLWLAAAARAPTPQGTEPERQSKRKAGKAAKLAEPRHELPPHSKANDVFLTTFRRALKALRQRVTSLPPLREPHEPTSDIEYTWFQIATAFEVGQGEVDTDRGFETAPTMQPTNQREEELWYRRILLRWPCPHASFNLAGILEEGIPATSSEDPGAQKDVEEAFKLYEAVHFVVWRWREAVGDKEGEGPLTLKNLEAAMDDLKEKLGKAPLPEDEERRKLVLERRKA